MALLFRMLVANVRENPHSIGKTMQREVTHEHIN